MEIYLTGVFIAATINLIKIVIIIFTFFSKKNNNLKRIGLYLNPATGGYIKEKPTLKTISFYTADALIITPLLSWLSVGYSVFVYLKGIINKVPIPEKIKEINFRLSSVDLPKEKVKEYMNEIAIFYGASGVNFNDRTLNDDDEDNADLYILEEAIETDDWHREIHLNRQISNYTLYSRTPDCDEFTSIEEYKFKGTDLWTRTIEDKIEHPGDLHWDIKDNVVMELDVRKRMENNRFYTPEDIEKKILELKEAVVWHEYKMHKIKYFIMFRHSDLFTEFEFKKYMRSELERINYGYKTLEDEVNKHGGVIIRHSILGMKPFPSIKPNDNLSEEETKKLYSITQEENISKFGISDHEFFDVDSIRQELEKYLAKLETL
jgi:hypothetical protein